MPLLVKENNSESPRGSTNDSSAESVNGSLRPEDSSDSPTKSANGSLFQQKTVCSLSITTQSADGSLFQQKTVCSLSHDRVDEWRSPYRRQFVPLAIGKWQSFPKKRQFVC